MLAMEYRKDLDGHLIGQGSPQTMSEMPVENMVSFVWWFFTRHADQQERDKFEARIWRPEPKSTKAIDDKSPWSAKNEMKGFAALKAETTG